MVCGLLLVANKLLYSFLFSMSQNKSTMRVAPSWLLTHRKLEHDIDPSTYPVILLVLRVFTDEDEPGPEPPSWVSLFSVLCICYQFNILINLAPVVRKADSAIHWINYFPKDSAFVFRDTYPLDSDLSSR